MAYKVLLSNGKTEIIPVFPNNDPPKSPEDLQSPEEFVRDLIEEVLYNLEDSTTTILDIYPTR